MGRRFPFRGNLVPAALLLAGTATAPSQERPPESSGIEENVEVRLVQMTIFAVDSQERPVLDLEPSEILIKDQGKRIEAAFLERVAVPEPPDTFARLFVNLPGGPGGPLSSSSSAAARFILFVDVENEPPIGHEERAAALSEFVAHSLQSTDQVAVMSYDGEARLETSFTTDQEEIRRAVTRAYGLRGRPRLDRTRRMRDLIVRLRSCDDTACVDSATAAYGFECRTSAQDFIRALEGTVRYAGGLRGRKTVLAITAGSSLDLSHEIAEAINYARGIGSAVAPVDTDLAGSANLQQLDEITRLAIEQGVTLHFVTQPLRGGGSFGAAESPLPASTATPLETSYAQAQREMSLVATSTGGNVVIDADPRLGLDRALELERSGYVLGYYLDAPPKPGSLRRVKIDTTRRGVRIIAARGYAPVSELEETIRAELTASDRPSIFPDGRRRISFALDVDPQELGYKVTKKEAITNFTLETAVYRENGPILTRTYHFVSHSYDKSNWKKDEIEPLQIRGWVEVPPGRYELRLVIRNPRADRQGEFSEILEVPPPDPQSSTEDADSLD